MSQACSVIKVIDWLAGYGLVSRIHIPSRDVCIFSRPALENTLPHAIGVGAVSLILKLTESEYYLTHPCCAEIQYDWCFIFTLRLSFLGVKALRNLTLLLYISCDSPDMMCNLLPLKTEKTQEIRVFLETLLTISSYVALKSAK